MAKQKDYSKWILSVIAVALIIVIYGGFQGWFKSSSYTYINNTEITNKLEQTQTAGCTLSLDKSNINVGDEVIGTIHDGKNTLCEVFSKKNGLWKKEFEGTTDANGNLMGSRVLIEGGTYLIKALCGDCVTNGFTLVVNQVGADANNFCTSLNKGYVGGREVADCSYCNTITEGCETGNNKAYCCTKESFQVGCNDLDFTKENFDNSLKTSTSCTDDIATHVDSCSNGLLDEWYCTDAEDVCKHTYYNCESMLGDGYYCSGGECKFSQEIVMCDAGCDAVTGTGSDSIPVSMLKKPYTCVDYPASVCEKGVYNIGVYPSQDSYSCCCWKCNKF